MTPKPLIGVPGRRKQGPQVEGFEGSLSVLDMDVYLIDYSIGVLNAGGLPVNIPLDANPADYAPYLHGVLLTGGADIDPSNYQQSPDGNGGYEGERDALELALLATALDHHLPILGICRGLQLINVRAGGTLHQHVPSHSRYDVPTSEPVHDVVFVEGSCVHDLFGDRAKVNSLHHQTIDTVGEDLLVTGRAEDGTVEAVESANGNVLAVQWHPEMLGQNDPVFGWLVERATARQLTAADPR